MVNFSQCWLCDHSFDCDDMRLHWAGQTLSPGPGPVMHVLTPSEFPGEGLITCDACVDAGQREIAEYRIQNEQVLLSDVLPSVHQVVRFWRPSRDWLQNAVFDVSSDGYFSTGPELSCRVLFQMDSRCAYGVNTARKCVPLSSILEQTPSLCKALRVYIERHPGTPTSLLLGRALVSSQV